MNLSPEERAKVIQANSERIKNLDDDQLKTMIDQVKNNKEQIRMMYKMQGMDLTDEQLE